MLHFLQARDDLHFLQARDAVPDELVPDSDDELLPALRESSESSEDEAEAQEKGAPSQLACEPSKLVCFSPRCPL